MEQPKTGDAQSAATMNYGLMDSADILSLLCSFGKTTCAGNKVFNEEEEIMSG